MKKKFNWRDIISEVLRITMIVQLGTYGLMHQLNELPQNKTINIMLGLTALAVFLVGLWFPYLIPNSPKEDDDRGVLLKNDLPLVADENLQRVALTDTHGPADLFGNYYSPASV